MGTLCITVATCSKSKIIPKEKVIFFKGTQMLNRGIKI